LHGVLD